MVAVVEPYRAEFSATVHRTKNRMVTIPAAIARQIGIDRGPKRIIDCLIRARGSGHWNEHLAYVTQKLQFRVPFEGGRRIEVRIRDIFEYKVVLPSGADLLLHFPEGDDPRTDGSINV